jgi:hypothetical protein
MLRRLLALILALTCAFAPAALAIEQPSAESSACCCGTSCPCPPTDCAPPPAAPTRSAAPSLPATAQRAVAAQARARTAEPFFLRFSAALAAEPALTLRVRFTCAAGLAPPARVALYTAHCSFLI